ncbi:MAG TPA: flagellar filament capping protein FliD, partial [Anaerovoracaceae bacterium]|nr:flagellar filament capping protein FliD [Anaerovoracaceae bacterium]
PYGVESFKITTAYGEEVIELKNAKVEGGEIADFDFSIVKDEEDNVIKDNSLTLRINGEKIVLNGKFDSIEDLAGYINDELQDKGITVTGDETENRLVFISKNDIVIESSDPDPENEGKLKLETMLGLKNGLTKASNSIDDVVKQINTAVNEDGESLGLRAAYDANLGKLMIVTKEQGGDQFIRIEENDLTWTIFGSENPVFETDETGENGEKVGIWGKDAVIQFNGDTVEQSSNNFSMFGVNYQLQSAGSGEIVTINVESDVNSIFDKVKEFVDDYNELIDELNGLLKEKNHRDFQPLTNEEKEAMKEKEIELWEEKAKSGLLRNDETITGILQSMRNGLYSKVEGLEGFNHITQIGITTGNYQSGGKLEINEEKLRQAIIDDSEGVIDLLFKTSDIDAPSGDTDAAAEKRANSGLVERLFDDMIIGMKDIVRRAGAGEDANTLRDVQPFLLIDFVTSGSISVMDRSLMDLGKRIAREEMNLFKREERYWSQFTAMEKALEQMNQQSTWLMSQLGQMGR